MEFIRETLLRLKPTGADGFEGLIAEVIFGITGIPCRLSKSGTQLGRDSGANDIEDRLYFEAKRYRDNLPIDKISEKLRDLANDKDEADILWVLGVTSAVADQENSSIYKSAFRDGISVLILDWQDTALPQLAIAIAMVKERVLPWIVEKLDDESIRQPLANAFDQLTVHSDFALLSEKLRRQLSAVELATTNAKLANKAWLTNVLSNEATARSKLGQPLTPLNKPNMTLPRTNVIQQVRQVLEGEDKPIFLLGEEGSGKSWAAASIMTAFDGLTIFISAERLGNRRTEEEIRELVVLMLAAQCDQANPDERIRKRWEKRLEAWEHSGKGNRFLVVLDGLNQRPELSWDEIILGFSEVISPSGGKLIATTRPHLFHSKISPGLFDGSYLTFSIANWGDSERDQLLSLHSIDPTVLDQVTAQSLKNPRLLGIALEILPKNNADVWRGLTTDRLLFEHLRLSRRYNIEPDTPDILAAKLIRHARDAAEKLQSKKPLQAALRFKSDAVHVAEGRFFETTVGTGRYKLKEEGLTLALGYALIDQLLDADDDCIDLDEAFIQILEPITALDRTAEVVMASLTVCAWHDKFFSREIFAALLDGFANLQNLDTKFYISFRDICFERFDVFLQVVEDCLLTNNHPINKDWLESVAHDAKDNKKKWEQLADAIERWFSYYSKDPANELRKYPNGLTNQKEIEKKTVRATETLNSMSPFEHELLSEMQDKNGDLGSLTALGLELLAHKPLAPFTRSFLRWGISIYIDNCWPALHSGFQRLANFNQVDWHEMRTAFRAAADSLNNSNPSIAGRSTVIQMLYATGTCEDRKRADLIKTDLFKGGHPRTSWRSIEGYCSSDPCDPDSVCPNNIEATAEKYAQIDVSKLFSGRNRFDEEMLRTDALPGLARFNPDIAVSKHKELLSTLPTRTGHALYNLIDCDFMMPLVSADLAQDIFAALIDGKSLATLEEKNRPAVIGYALYLLSEHLSVEQQFKLMSLTMLTGSFNGVKLKSFTPQAFTEKLVAAHKTENPTALVALLTFLKYTDTPIDEKSTELVLKLASHSDTFIRSCALYIILVDKITAGIEQHCHSKWNSSNDDIGKDEAWYGSFVLIEGVKLSIFTAAHAFDRCEIKPWVKSITSLPENAQQLITQKMDVAFQVLLYESKHVSTEINDAIKTLDVEIINHEDIENLVSVAPDMIGRWSKSLITTAPTRLLQNLCYLLAKPHSQNYPEEAVQLIEKAEAFNSKAFTRTFGNEMESIWGSSTAEPLKLLRTERLDNATTDYAIAQEVLAAEKYGKEASIANYVNERLKQDHPYTRARAIMVAGFSNQTDIFAEQLKSAALEHGLVGDAAKVALESHKRCVWSKHWAEAMIKAETKEDFWCKSRLLIKIADNRIGLFTKEKKESDLGLYWPTYWKVVTDELNQRTKKWEEKRKKTFLGYESVNEIFI